MHVLLVYILYILSLLSRHRLGGLLRKLLVFGAIFFAVTFADGLARSWNKVSGVFNDFILFSYLHVYTQGWLCG